MSAPVPDGVRACTAVEWRQAVRDAGDGRLFVKSDMLVLLALSIRMSSDGSDAFPSMATLAEDTGVSVGTVKRALRLARESGYLFVERRGGRRGDGSTVSNRYRAVVPDSPGQGSTRDPLTEPQGSTCDPLNLASRGHQEHLKGSKRASQGVTTDPLPRPLRPRPDTTSSSSPADFDDDETIARTHLIEHAHASPGIRNPAAVIASQLRTATNLVAVSRADGQDPLENLEIMWPTSRTTLADFDPATWSLA